LNFLSGRVSSEPETNGSSPLSPPLDNQEEK
jgi:hypothetical protein